MFCKFCGKEINEEINICPNCNNCIIETFSIGHHKKNIAILISIFFSYWVNVYINKHPQAKKDFRSGLILDIISISSIVGGSVSGNDDYGMLIIGSLIKSIVWLYTFYHTLSNDDKFYSIYS